MTIKFFKVMRTCAAVAAFGALVAACATPAQGPMFDRTTQAIRAAQTAGAMQHAPGPYARANEIYRKAEAMHASRRTDRAQKLLELATAQATLAKAMSEATQAETSLQYIRTTRSR